MRKQNLVKPGVQRLNGAWIEKRIINPPRSHYRIQMYIQYNNHFTSVDHCETLGHIPTARDYLPLSPALSLYNFFLLLTRHFNDVRRFQAASAPWPAIFPCEHWKQTMPLFRCVGRSTSVDYTSISMGSSRMLMPDMYTSPQSQSLGLLS